MRLRWFGDALNRNPNLRSFVLQQRLASKELTKDDVDSILRQQEHYAAFNRDAVRACEVNQLAANAPCEDQHAQAWCPETSSWFMGVFDGHAGVACAKAVSQRLFDYMAASLWDQRMLGRQLAKLQKIKSSNATAGDNHAPLEWLHSSAGAELLIHGSEIHQANMLRYVQRRLQTVSGTYSMHTVRTALQEAFTALDDDLAQAAMPQANGLVDAASVSVVMAGSCACVAHLRGPHLHVANVGDSAAVLGVRNDRGGWTARALTHDHTNTNPEEVKRIRNSHPTKEANTVLKNGRLLNLLMPLRAFGDVRFKWQASLQEVVLQPYAPQGSSVVPPFLETPPYLTATPEVYYHRLTPQDKFLVIASDGLWEQLQPERVVKLLSDHMLGRQTVGPFTRRHDAALKEIMLELRQRREGHLHQSLDENGATHLIRNALDSSSNPARQLLQLTKQLAPAPGAARSSRDDITIIVVYFDSDFVASNYAVEE